MFWTVCGGSVCLNVGVGGRVYVASVFALLKSCVRRKTRSSMFSEVRMVSGGITDVSLSMRIRNFFQSTAVGLDLGSSVGLVESEPKMGR